MRSGRPPQITENQQTSEWSQGCWQRPFAIDLRSLAAFRISIALVMLIDLARRTADLSSMYASGGVFPLSAVHDYYGKLWKWSFHLWNDAWGYQAFLFGLAGCCAMCLLVGYRTRITTCLAWALTCSLNTRAPLLVNGGDVLLCIGLFWGIFLPLGARFSIDARRQEDQLGDKQTFVSIATAGILLQVSMMYLFTGLWKCNAIWFNGDALSFALSDVTVTRPLGHWLLNFPSLLRLMTYSTLALELLGPFLLFSPIGSRFLRPATLVCLIGLHIGIELTISVMVFSYASLALLLLFIPGNWWTKIASVVQSSQAASGSEEPSIAPSPPVEAAGMTFRKPAWSQRLGVILGSCCIGYALLFNIFTLSYRQGWPVSLSSFYQVGTLMNFGQRWTMFDKPQNHLYRFAFYGRLKNGQQVELLRDLAISQEDPFPRRVAPFPTQRWMQLHREATAPAGLLFRHEMARYLASYWNQTHPDAEQFLEGDLTVYRANRSGEVLPDRLYMSTYYDARATGRVQSGLRQGKWILRYDNETKAAEGRYEQGQEVGEWIFWDEAGKPQYAGTFIEGKKQGPWTFWNDDGSTSILTFRDDELVTPGSE